MKSVLLRWTPSLNDRSKLKRQFTAVKSSSGISVRPSLNPYSLSSNKISRDTVPLKSFAALQNLVILSLRHITVCLLKARLHFRVMRSGWIWYRTSRLSGCWAAGTLGGRWPAGWHRPATPYTWAAGTQPGTSKTPEVWWSSACISGWSAETRNGFICGFSAEIENGSTVVVGQHRPEMGT